MLITELHRVDTVRATWPIDLDVLAHNIPHLFPKSTRGCQCLVDMLAPSTGSRPLRQTTISVSRKQELQQNTQAEQAKPTSQGSYSAWGLPRNDGHEKRQINCLTWGLPWPFPPADSGSLTDYTITPRQQGTNIKSRKVFYAPRQPWLIARIQRVVQHDLLVEWNQSSSKECI